MESPTDITQKFVDKQYLIENGPADILLYPERMYHFLSKHGLIHSFSQPELLEKAYFRDADESHSGSKSCVIDYPKARVIRSASIQVCDHAERESWQQFCPEAG